MKEAFEHLKVVAGHAGAKLDWSIKERLDRAIDELEKKMFPVEQQKPEVKVEPPPVVEVPAEVPVWVQPKKKKLTA